MPDKGNGGGFSVGKRTEESHAKDGWTVERRRDAKADAPVKRGLRGFLRKRGKKAK